jgi:hypothetical protein
MADESLATLLIAWTIDAMRRTATISRAFTGRFVVIMVEASLSTIGISIGCEWGILACEVPGFVQGDVA